MRIALSQINPIVGDFEYNFNKIIASIKKAKKDSVDLIVFPELAICGYPPLDLLEHEHFVKKCLEYVNKIANYCKDIAAIIGSPSVNQNKKGKPIYNSAFFIDDEKIVEIINKSLLPTYDIFDEYRYFEPSSDFKIINFKGKKIAITICEDLWDDPPLKYAFGRSNLYNLSPITELIKLSPDFIINIAASPFEYNKIEVKKQIFEKYAKQYKIPMFYVNQVGSNTDLIFDGGSMIVKPNGDIYDMLNFFDEDYKVFELSEIINSAYKNEIIKPAIERIHDALVLGIKDYFVKLGLTKAVVGLSGGIDSAVVTVLAVKALGKENVRVLLMPSKYSSSHSIDDAVALANNLKIKYDIIPIQPIVDQIRETLNPLFEGTKEDITEENIQARVRGVLLMAVSNKFGNLLLNTSNKSEISVGYGTLYGDMNGALSVLGDVYKTDIYKLAYFINKEEEIIPHNILIKAPSAELRPNQKDTDSLPEYELLDNILFRLIEQQRSLEEIVADGFDKNTILKVYKMLNSCEYKRFQAPPVLKISSKAFGHGRKMPIVARY